MISKCFIMTLSYKMLHHSSCPCFTWVLKLNILNLTQNINNSKLIGNGVWDRLQQTIPTLVLYRNGTNKNT